MTDQHDEDTRAAQARAVLACRHDICACGQVTPSGQVVGDPLGEIGPTEYTERLA